MTTEDFTGTIVQIMLDNRDTFDYITESAMPSGNTLDVATINDETCEESGPMIVVGFVSMHPDGSEVRSQFGMKVAQFDQIHAALRGRYPNHTTS